MSDCATLAYVEKVKERLTAYFDFETPPALLKKRAQVFAHFIQTDEKYFMSRRMNLYTVNAHQYIAVGTFDRVTVNELQSVYASMQALIDTTGPTPNTMSTDYTFALVAREAVDAEAVKSALASMSYHKSFTFGWHGWADLGLIVVDPVNERVYANRYAHKQLETVLWSFNSEPLIRPRRSLLSRLPLFKCGGCCGG